MIEAIHISKNYGDVAAVNDISLTIKEASVFGMIGTNGAGKSTMLRMMAGILRPSSGEIKVDGAFVYENPAAKSEVFYISDDQYYSANYTPEDYIRMYSTYYPNMDIKRALKIASDIGLPVDRKISTFSKGMKRQVALVTGICANTRYLMCDETFDGLDPVMRQATKSLFAEEIESRGLTPILASHNLRELEDICDYVGLLHKGGVLLSKDIVNMKTSAHKLQCVLKDTDRIEEVMDRLDIMKRENRGSLITIIARGEIADIRNEIELADPAFVEVLPLTLEELFVCETEVAGYDIKKLIL